MTIFRCTKDKFANRQESGRPRAVLHRLSSRAFLNWSVCLCASVLLNACIRFPEPEPDDEGHASFARQAIPMVLGRKAYGVDEVEVVADIAQLHGRDVAVEMLMQDDQFIAHWTDAIIDLLRIPRDNLGIVGVAQDSGCWGPPLRSEPDPSIAEWIRDHAPDDAGGPSEYNMTDVVNSAIALDDLSPLYRANLFPMFMRTGGFNNRATERNELYKHFSTTYLNRDTACLKCHNPTYSTSNKVDGTGNIVWRRTWTIPGHAEKALFGNYNDALATDSNVQYVMRGDVRQTVSAAGPSIRPWNMSEQCAIDSRSTVSTATPTHRDFTQNLTTNYAAAKFGSLDGAINPQVSLWELEGALQQGILDLQDGYGRYFNPVPLTPDETLYCNLKDNIAGCTGCHSGAAASANLDLSVSNLDSQLVNAASQGFASMLATRVVPGNVASSEFHRRINSPPAGQEMPPGGGVNASLIAASADWINGGAPTFDDSVCTSSLSSIPDVEPDEAFAFLTATNLVDGIWMNMMGKRLTIDNSYSRTKEQRDALRVLTEYTFLPADWSLSSVIKRVMSSDWLGRRAPTISQQDNAYTLPLVIDPWVQADPSEVPTPDPHEMANGQGELVEMFRVNTLLRSISSALGWEEPRVFPGGGYPSPLDQDLGQFISAGNPGFQGISFQSLLALEESVGLCEKSGKTSNAEDWIDRLTATLADYNTEHPDTPLTIADAWKTLKDRLVQDPTIEMSLPVELANISGVKNEAEALVALFNEGASSVYTLASVVTELPESELESKLREACGVLVKSPEFLMTQVTPRGYSDNFLPDPPVLNVCLDGEPCGYLENCAAWTPVLYRMGKFTACEDRSVREYTPALFPFPGPIIVAERLRSQEICPPEICRFMELPRTQACLTNPEQCKRLPPIPPPPLNIVDFDGKTPDNIRDAGILALNANSASVVKTEGVMIRGVTSRRWQPLKSDSRIVTGDLLYVPYDATLFIKHRTEGLFGSGPLKSEQFKEKLPHQGQLISVTGTDAIGIIEELHVRKGELGPRELQKYEQAGTFETRPVTKKDWARIQKYVVKPIDKPRLDVRQIIEQNMKDFDEQHAGLNELKD